MNWRWFALAAAALIVSSAIETKRNVMYWARGDLKVGDRHAEAFEDVDACLTD